MFTVAERLELRTSNSWSRPKSSLVPLKSLCAKHFRTMFVSLSEDCSEKSTETISLRNGLFFYGFGAVETRVCSAENSSSIASANLRPTSAGCGGVRHAPHPRSGDGRCRSRCPPARSVGRPKAFFQLRPSMFFRPKGGGVPKFWKVDEGCFFLLNSL